MTVRINKFDGWGNDFLVLDLADLPPSGGVDPATGATPDWSALARTWCDRSTGVGADGLLLSERIDDVNARMKLYNSDGSSA
ncbi:MAG: hypothetical protein ACKO97_00100, partial [Actinomycetota bacterium]